MSTSITSYESIFLRMSRASSLLGKLLTESIVSAGLTPGEYNFLRLVEVNPLVTARDIQHELNAAAPSVAQMVAKLEKKGFLKRDRSAADGRMLHLKLTFWGARALKKAKAAIEARLKKSNLSQKLLSSLVKDLDSVLDSLDEEKA